MLLEIQRELYKVYRDTQGRADPTLLGTVCRILVYLNKWVGIFSTGCMLQRKLREFKILCCVFSLQDIDQQTSFCKCVYANACNLCFMVRTAF